MSTAREEAERRWPDAAFGGGYGLNGEPITRASISREGFVAGAQWQAKQPVEITDEMAERAALAGLNSERRRHGLDERTTLDDFDNQTAREWRADARAQLEAALEEEA